MKIFVSFKTFSWMYIYIYTFHRRTISTKYQSLREDGVFTVPCHELFNRYTNFKEYVLKRVCRILDSLPRVMRTEHFSQQLLIIREINRISIVSPHKWREISYRKRNEYLLSSDLPDWHTFYFNLIFQSIKLLRIPVHKFIYNFEHDFETIPINFPRHL